MNALRFFSIIKDKKITIDIPPDFISKNVEIIILPLQPKKKNIEDLLLEGPVWSEEDIANIKAMRKEFKNWKIEEF